MVCACRCHRRESIGQFSPYIDARGHTAPDRAWSTSLCMAARGARFVTLCIVNVNLQLRRNVVEYNATRPPMTHLPPPLPASSPPQSLSPPSAGGLLARSRPGVPLGWALTGLALCSAVVGAGIAWSLSVWLNWAATLAAPVAAVVAVLLGVWPMALLAFKGAQRLPLLPDPAQDFDASTGAMTRTLFLDLAEREWSRARRYGTGATLLLVDLDRTARLAEVHGPGTADALLRELARQTSATLRGADALARFSHSQLAIFLAQSDATGALDVAERVRERAEKLELPPHATARQRATVSVGVAQLRAAHLNLQALVADAQDATVAARQAGGNCVRAAPVDLARLLWPDPAPKDRRTRPQ